MSICSLCLCCYQSIEKRLLVRSRRSSHVCQLGIHASSCVRTSKDSISLLCKNNDVWSFFSFVFLLLYIEIKCTLCVVVFIEMQTVNTQLNNMIWTSQYILQNSIFLKVNLFLSCDVQSKRLYTIIEFR